MGLHINKLHVPYSQTADLCTRSCSTMLSYFVASSRRVQALSDEPKKEDQMSPVSFLKTFF
jgi:hypothetical protein